MRSSNGPTSASFSNLRKELDEAEEAKDRQTERLQGTHMPRSQSNAGDSTDVARVQSHAYGSDHPPAAAGGGTSMWETRYEVPASASASSYGLYQIFTSLTDEAKVAFLAADTRKTDRKQSLSGKSGTKWGPKLADAAFGKVDNYTFGQNGATAAIRIYQGARKLCTVNDCPKNVKVLGGAKRQQPQWFKDLTEEVAALKPNGSRPT